MPSLLFFKGQEEVLRFPLAGSHFKIGRHPSNDLTLPDEEISRFHATVECRPGTAGSPSYWVMDQSRNGTLLNGRRVQSSPLREQDTLLIGNWRVVFVGEADWSEKETIVQRKTKSAPSFCGMIGKGEPMQRVFSMIEKVAPTVTTVLILGETGTGKELVARAIHACSPRERRSFVPLNCGSISPQLIESELFGHERGAFTGALSRHLGAFEQARGGTLFLDEVGELPLELQPKLLRVLEEKKFRRVGGIEEVEANVRIVAATHRNLESLTGEGKFREDLYFRLYAVPIFLPPLRERKGDIPMLVEHFIASFQNGSKPIKISPDARQKLVDYPWKGNVRELKNVITRSLLFAAKDPLGPEEILFLDGRDYSPADNSLDSVEKEAIASSLKENNWNKKKVALLLGIAKSTLFHKIKEYRIKKE